MSAIHPGVTPRNPLWIPSEILSGFSLGMPSRILPGILPRSLPDLPPGAATRIPPEIPLKFLQELVTFSKKRPHETETK